MKILDENEQENLWLRFGAGFSPHSNGMILEYDDRKYYVDIYSGLTFIGEANEARVAPAAEKIEQEEYVLPSFTVTTR